MLDPSQLGGAPQGGPAQSINIPGSGGGQDADEPAEKAVQAAIKRWMASADDPQEHAFAAQLYQKVTQFIAKEADEVHNAAGLNSVQKSIARARGL